MSRVRIHLCLSVAYLVSAFVCCNWSNRASAAEEKSTTKKLSAIDQQTLQAIITAKFVSGVKSSTFLNGLRRVAGQLPELIVTTGDEALHWQSLEVLKVSSPFVGGNLQLTAFKFRSPLKKPADLHWSFAVPDHLGEWSIVPVKGEMKGFESFRFLRTITVPQVPLEPGSLFVVQELMQGRILPDEEYIIWYTLPDGANDQFWAGIRLTEANTRTAGVSAEDICRNVGLDPKDHSFTADEDGLKKAFDAAGKMVNSQPPDLAGLNRTLRSVWTLLPTIEVANGTKLPLWNQIQPKFSQRFHAVRFKSATAKPANLNWCYVVENNLMRWGFLEKQNNLQVRNAYALELNCPIPGVRNPEKNLTIFQKLAGELIRPDGEYVIWFAQGKEPLSGFELAATVTPVEKGVDDEESLKPLDSSSHFRYPYADSRPIGEAIGISIPEIPSEDRVNAALDRCQRMIDAGERSREFTRLIQFTIPALMELPTDGDSVKWHDVRLNEKGRRMAAFRLNQDRMTSGRMVMALTRPANTVSQFSLPRNYRLEDSRDNRPPNSSILMWGIINDSWPGMFFQHRLSQRDIADLDLGLPPNQAIDIDLYENWVFESDEPIVVVFSPPDDKPVTLNFAVGFDEKPKSNTTRSIKSAIEYLGLKEIVPGNAGEILNQHAYEVVFVRFVLTNDAVVSADLMGSLKWWVKVPGVEAPELGEQAKRVIRVISDDRKLVAAVDYDLFEVTVLQPGTLEEIAHFKLPDERIPQKFRFSHDGRYLLGSYGGQNSGVNEDANHQSILYKWDLDDPEHPVTREFDKDQPISSAVWLTDGRIVTVGYRRVDPRIRAAFSPKVKPAGGYQILLPDGQIEILDESKFETKSTLKTDGCDWIDIECSGDETRMATLAQSGWVTVWDLKSIKEIASFPVHVAAKRMSLSKDGSRLAVISREGEVQICDVATQRFLSCGVGKIPQANDIAISPDGKVIVTGGKDGAVRRYKVLDNRPKSGLPLVMTNSIGMKLNWIPSGKFLMGRSENLPYSHDVPVPDREKDQLPRHSVNLTHPFYLGRYEVTVTEFRQFVEATSYQTTAEKSGRGGSHVVPNSFEFKADPQWNWKNPGFPQKEDHPVVQVSYDDAVAFCEWLSKKEGAKYRLPTEAEWEYCCRAGSPYEYYFAYGNWLFRCANIADGELIKAYGKFPGAFGNSDGNAFTASVGSYVPNGFALFDMHGNALEWCADFYDAGYYARSPADDPQGDAKGTNRVQRGGGFMFGGTKSHHREWGPPDQTQSHLGFRIVREIP